MDQKIVSYINSNQVFIMATAYDNKPYCANCFYVFVEETKTLIFLSDDKTKHIKEAMKNKRVGGSIWNGITEVPELQGIQFIGQFIKPTKEQNITYYAHYYKKFPFAKKMPSPIWGVQLKWIKMTDNTLGFGTKLIWED